MKKQAGFTLIELVVVIVILGILAATALPKFIDMSGDAEKAAVQGVAGALSGAGNINYGKYKAAGGTTTGAIAISSSANVCTTDVYNNAASLLTGSVSLVTAASASANQYQIANGSPSACSSGVVVQCTLTSQHSQSATAYIPCVN